LVLRFDGKPSCRQHEGSIIFVSTSRRLDLHPSKRQPTEPLSPDANLNLIGKVVADEMRARRPATTGIITTDTTGNHGLLEHRRD
jgi:hypothetical protein